MKDTGRVTEPLRPHLRRMLFGRHSRSRRIRDLHAMTTVDRAHLVMLADCGIVETASAARLLDAIDALRANAFAPIAGEEPIRGLYFLYEQHLIAETGAAIGGILQTARSRNDLQATMLHLGMRAPYRRLVREALRLLGELIRHARRHQHVTMPLYTHGQVAVPDTLGHYYAAVGQAIARDIDALLAIRGGLQASPLGAGAAGGTEWPIDTARTASLLGFDCGPLNAIDAIASRDVVLRLLAALTIYGVTASRLAADLWLWSTSEFGFLQFPDDLVGVSSAMPQKRNPFVLEHVLGRSAAAFGSLGTAAMAMHGAPFTNTIHAGTEAVAPLWQALRHAADITVMLRAMIAGATPDPDAMARRAAAGHADATALANQLVREAGLDFRSAHATVGACVRDVLASPPAEPRPSLAEAVRKRVAMHGDTRPQSFAEIAQAREFGGGPGPEAFDACRRHLVRAWRRARTTIDGLEQQWAASSRALDEAARDVTLRLAAAGTIAYAFCVDDSTDPVAARILAACLDLVPHASMQTDTGLTLDSFPVLACQAGGEQRFLFLRTRRVLTDALDTYLPWIDRHLPALRALVVVNWHEGANAPDRIFTVHTTGDAPSGVFCPADPLVCGAFVRALERHRAASGLDDWQVLMEATHWSGIQRGHPVAWLSRVRTTLLDLEIGSTADSWRHPAAAAVAARALLDVFTDWRADAAPLLAIGGTHCDPVFRDAVLGGARPHAIAHLLPNRLLVDGGYGEPAGLTKLRACVRGIRGGIAGILCHESVKASYRTQAQRLADEVRVPLWKHHAFRARNAVRVPSITT